MSKDKGRRADCRKALMAEAERGGILVNAEGGRAECADLLRLAREGRLRRVRVKVESPFGQHIRRTYYVPANTEVQRRPD